jgi:hypothetical protein
MNDFAIYWRDFAVESGANGKPATGWATSREWLVDRIKPGDRVWLFTGGDSCGMPEPQLAYLAAIFFVEGTGHHPRFDPSLPRRSPRYRITADKARSYLIAPLLLIDDVLRQAKYSKDRHIGEVRQTPWQLSWTEIGELRSRLHKQRSELYNKIFPGQ